MVSEPLAAEAPNRRTKSAGKAAVAAEVWAVLHELIQAWQGDQKELIETLQMTPGEMKALISIESGDAQPMRALAHAWHCDASVVTWMVDRLEARGLVERRPYAGDRRVKTIVLTPDGEALQQRLQAAMKTPPSQLMSLTLAQLEELRDLLGQVVTSDCS